jgi:putative nucleotidyltransferase with HDIG domain
VIDAKSPYTSGHSTRVAQFATMIGEQMGVPAVRRRWLHRAALLHDIGKLGVSNTILDKPGKLDTAEWEIMRTHASHTQEILGRVGALNDLAPVAAAHHERLDGRGYPLGLSDVQISRETRIITICDFYDALTAERPYRSAMPTDEALAIIGAEVGSAIDSDCFDALLTVVPRD